MPAVSWLWVPSCGSLEPSRRDSENAQKTEKNGEEMDEIQPKKCEGANQGSAGFRSRRGHERGLFCRAPRTYRWRASSRAPRPAGLAARRWRRRQQKPRGRMCRRDGKRSTQMVGCTTSLTRPGGRARRRRSRCTFGRGALRTRGSARMDLAALERGSGRGMDTTFLFAFTHSSARLSPVR